MIVLDENIPADEVDQLRRWRMRLKQIGPDLGRFGLKDGNEIIPLLHQLRRVTFFTRDEGFYDPNLRHQSYGLVYLDVRRSDSCKYIRQLLRHRDFNTTAKRLGNVVRVTPHNVFCWRLGMHRRLKLDW